MLIVSIVYHWTTRDTREAFKALYEPIQISYGPYPSWGLKYVQKFSKLSKITIFDSKIEFRSIKYHIFMLKITQEHPGDVFR